MKTPRITVEADADNSEEFYGPWTEFMLDAEIHEVKSNARVLSLSGASHDQKLVAGIQALLEEFYAETPVEFSPRRRKG